MNKFLSRKFLMALIAAVAAFIKALDPTFPDEALRTILFVSLGYMASEGLVDAVSQLTKWLVAKREITKNESKVRSNQPCELSKSNPF